MAGITDNTVFAGKEAQGFYSAAILTGDTKSRVKGYTNVKSKMLVSRLDVGSNILQAADCTFTDAGDVTLSQKTLTVCPIKINKSFCIEEFEANYLSAQLKAGANDAQVPASFEEYFLAEVAKVVSLALENTIWQGDAGGSPYGLCDGYFTLLTAAGDFIPVSGTTLTAANIIAEITKVYLAIPAAIRLDADTKIFISPAAAAFYKLANVPLAGTQTYTYTGDRPLDFLGMELIVSAGMPTNDMVAANLNNLFFGTDLFSDFDHVKILNQSNVTGEPTVRFLARFLFGAQIGVTAEVVWYT